MQNITSTRLGWPGSFLNLKNISKEPMSGLHCKTSYLKLFEEIAIQNQNVTKKLKTASDIKVWG